ncbi:hypothetical protein HPB52_017599 [Rhipicephalus sanguineus]|uniref:BPTI/Kunitz inhibitor domain-containing protein n=1 Tax=Rhipicephalus sanguineus TaxID=34632 RepID=A0A9D4SRQ7_RHISA|nr:hypothetical protein HPB52_017599 [Rhipicephalus sanguineus]
MEQPLQKNRERYARPLPLEMQWAASPYWAAAPVDFWAQSATGQGYPDLSCNEEAEPSATNRGVSAAESTWMSNVTRMLVFSVLLIALLVASLLLARTSTWLAEHDEVTGHPEDHQHLSPFAVRVASGKSSGVGSWMRANSSRPVAVGTKDDLLRKSNSREEIKTTSTEETETTEGVTSTLVDMPQKVTRRAKRGKKCEAFSFTFCGAPKHKFYFNGSQGACLSVADLKGAALCNRGANKFASLASCDAACGSNANTVEAKCDENVLFTKCMREKKKKMSNAVASDVTGSAPEPKSDTTSRTTVSEFSTTSVAQQSYTTTSATTEYSESEPPESVPTAVVRSPAPILPEEDAASAGDAATAV